MRLGLELSAEQLAELARALKPLVLAELAAEDVPNGSPWFSLAAAADYLSVSARTLEREIGRGGLRSSTLGRRRLIHRDDLDALARNGDGGGSNASHSTPPPGGVE